jgi:hypothetical protein
MKQVTIVYRDGNSMVSTLKNHILRNGTFRSGTQFGFVNYVDCSIQLGVVIVGSIAEDGNLVIVTDLMNGEMAVVNDSILHDRRGIIMEMSVVAMLLSVESSIDDAHKAIKVIFFRATILDHKRVSRRSVVDQPTGTFAWKTNRTFHCKALQIAFRDVKDVDQRSCVIRDIELTYIYKGTYRREKKRRAINQVQNLVHLPWVHSSWSPWFSAQTTGSKVKKAKEKAAESFIVAEILVVTKANLKS